ncbi:MAG: TonB-dependent receptor [Cytophagales bacterium]|nr:TonB-dependent receptor [Cytophagales bacterium]
MILIGVLLASSSDAQRQRLDDIYISINIDNITLEDALRLLSEETEFNFSYNDLRVDEHKIVTAKVKNKSMKVFLKKMSKDYNLKFKRINENIYVSRSERAGADVEEEISPFSSQEREVTGKITSSDDGEGLPGVNVIVKGTSLGTVTDIEGNYAIDVSGENPVLVFSSVGYVQEEIAVGNQTVIDIGMVPDITALEEIVVVGYGTQKKMTMTGSVVAVKTDEIINIPAANLSNTIAGRVPGVQVVGNSGLAGAPSTIRIRGSSGEPLYVINGVIREKADFDALDPNEVENINFLKDAASTAIYGSTAGNGVVIVTTKSGSVQKPQFEYRTSYSTSRTTKPVQSYSATQELEYVNNMQITRGQDAPYEAEIFEYFEDRTYDINDLIWQNPKVMKHNLSVDGGSESVTYYFMGGYHSEEGSYHNTGYDRYNFRSDVTAKITERFKVNVNIGGNQRNYNRWYWPYDGAEDFRVGDWYRATFNWTKLYPFYVDEQGNPTNDPNDIPIKTAGGYHPPEIMLNGGYRDIKRRTLDGIIRFDLDLGELVDGLSTSFQAQNTAFDYNMKSFVLHNEWYIFQPASATNQFIPGPVDFTQVGRHNLSAGYENIQESSSFQNSYQLNWFLNYQKTFDRHDVSAVAVYEQAGGKDKSLYGRAEDLLSSSIDQIYNASSDTERRWFSGGENEWARASWIGRVNYNFDSKYIVEFSFRYDGNYRFAPEKRWGFFPSFSAGWIISEENFLNNSSWLSHLKLRGSYGTTGSDKFGNDPIAPWQWTNNYTKTTGFVFGNTLYDGLRPGRVPNPDITWYTNENWNVGLDFGFLDDRLTGEFDIWGKRESDILGTRLGSTPTTFGADLPAVNYAERSWQGFEILANWEDNAGPLRYDVYANMGYAVDQWDIYDEPESFTDGTYENNWRSRIGKPADRLYGLISKGIIRTQEELDAIPEGYTVYGREPQIGTLLFEDIRGDNYSEGPDGKIDNNDMTYLSDNGAPRINFGFGFNVEWKGFAVNAHFQGVGAYDRMVRTRNGGGVFQVDRPYFELWADNYWTPETPDAKYPRIAGNWRQAEYGGASSSFWVRNGSYLRLKNLNIGYSLPGQWVSKLGLTNVQFFINGINLFVITGYEEHDPEQDTLDSYPLMKTYTGGLNIKF